jgi:hypothetical protein
MGATPSVRKKSSLTRNRRAFRASDVVSVAPLL